MRPPSNENDSRPRAGAGLPSELLLRRPDVARAEARLAAADADIAAARAALLPSLNLNVAVGSGGESLGCVLQDPAYTLAAALVAPIFDAGRDLAQARREELLASYRQAVVAAFADVQAALQATASLLPQAQAQEEELRQATRARDLAESRWRADADTLLVLLDAQRTLQAAQDEAVPLRPARLRAAVSLYRALGGRVAGARVRPLRLTCASIAAPQPSSRLRMWSASPAIFSNSNSRNGA